MAKDSNKIFMDFIRVLTWVCRSTEAVRCCWKPYLSSAARRTGHLMKQRDWFFSAWCIFDQEFISSPVPMCFVNVDVREVLMHLCETRNAWKLEIVAEAFSSVYSLVSMFSQEMEKLACLWILLKRIRMLFGTALAGNLLLLSFVHCIFLLSCEKLVTCNMFLDYRYMPSTSCWN